MSANLSVYTFGGLRILDAGEPLAGVESRKIEALFIYLALADRLQPREILAELLWDDRTQQQAGANLRRVLSGLRKHFGPYVEITRSTAALKGECDLWLDLRELQTGIEGLKAKSDRLTSEIVTQADEALRLYHGGFLEGFHVRGARNFDVWLSDQREYWRQIVLDTADSLCDIYETYQLFKDGIDLARWALQIDPLQESLHRQLMRLLVLSGQRTDALKQYESCNQLLEDELGVPPEPETDALLEAIANGAFGVAQSVSTIPTRNQFEGREPYLGLDKRIIPSNLPAQTTSFIGRETELIALDGLLTNPEIRLVTILGPGGIGKTRLALSAAERQLTSGERSSTPHFKDGIYFVTLASINSVTRLVSAITDVLGLNFTGSDDPQHQLVNYLQDKTLLLILDNFEHLLDGVVLIEKFLRLAPGVCLLVTSRERLYLHEEQIFSIQGLEIPHSVTLGTAEEGMKYASVALFIQTAGRIKRGFSLDEGNLSEVCRISQLVEGMPLALELAAGWVDLLSLADIASEIGKGLDFLETDLHNVPEHQRSMRAVFEVSWQQLTDEEKRIFPRLSVFRGGFSRQAARQVTDVSLRQLATFSSKSLLQFDETHNRYHIHELLRQYAMEKLADIGDMEDVQQAHGQYYLSELASLEADVKGQRQIEAFKEIDSDFHNIAQAWLWALDQAQFSLVDCSLETLAVFCLYFSRPREGHELFNAAREGLMIGTDDRLLGRLLARHAWLKSQFGIATNSIEADLERSWKIFERLDLQQEIARVYLAQGYFEVRIHKDRVAALQKFEWALQIFRVLDDRFYMTMLLGRIGYCWENPSKFIDFTKQSLALALETGNYYYAANAQNNLGGMLMAMGESISGEQNHYQALKLRKRIGKPGRKYFSSDLAYDGFLRGDLGQMKRYLSPQDNMVIGKVNPISIGKNLSTRALLAAVSGDLETAEQLARRSLEIPSLEEITFGAYWALAMVYLGRDNLAEASKLLSVEYQRSWIRWYPGFMTRSLPVAALIIFRRDRPARATQILSLATNHPASQIGWMCHWSSAANLRSELEQTLGEATFQEEWDRGMSLDLVETINLLASELSGELQ
jgi:predicted ATPase/DNA-binding SARP family transcriptional activator